MGQTRIDRRFLGALSRIRLYFRLCVRLLFPERCPVCGQSLRPREIVICQSCLKKVESVKLPTCKRCLTELPPLLAKRRLCQRCRQDKTPLDQAWATVYYEETSKRIFHEIKFKRKEWLIPIFKRQMVLKRNELLLENFDCITWVPMEFTRRMDRGFNQSETIARILGRRLGLPPTRLLKKSGGRPPQSRLDFQERRLLIENVFRLRKGRKIRGKRILLVDDIFTTGATANACAKRLKEAGASYVGVFVVAKTPLS